MSKTRYRFLAVALGLGLATGSIHADADQTSKRPEKTVSFGLQALEDRFEAAAPAVGDMVPDLSVYTAAGEKVKFRDLILGHYSVVVFGCLT